VLLPEDDVAGAWSRLAQLESTSRILQRDVATIDLRFPDRLVVKVTDTGPKEAPKKNHPLGKNT
jgi:cell division protein FtsQ